MSLFAVFLVYARINGKAFGWAFKFILNRAKKLN